MTWGDADTVAEVERLRAENLKLRAALEAVSRYFPDDTSSSIGKLVRAALEETK